MEGGGCWALAPGQITDDSELAMCLLHGLVEGKGKLNTGNIVKYYGQWYVFGPFDIGQTTRSALKAINVDKPRAVNPRTSAHSWNMNSLSNGSLMKVTPLAVWCQNLTPSEVALAIKEDVTIMHPNPFMSQLITGYALSIKYLINNPNEVGRGRKAFEVAVELSKEKGVDAMLKEWLEMAEALIDFTGEKGFINLDSYNPQPQMGFAKHAIILSYYCLLRIEKDFTDDLG